MDRGETIPLRLHEDVEDHAVLIDSSSEIVSDAVDLEEDFVEMYLSPVRGRQRPIGKNV